MNTVITGDTGLMKICDQNDNLGSDLEPCISTQLWACSLRNPADAISLWFGESIKPSLPSHLNYLHRPSCLL